MARETETRLAWLHVPGEEEVPEEVRSLWQRADEKLGFVPNVLRTWALRPDHMLRWRKYMDELLKGASGLTEAQREMIGVVVSSTNRCHYCMTSHSGVLRSLTGDPVLVDQLLQNYRHAQLEERERAMLDFAVKVTEEAYRCTEADLAALQRCRLERGGRHGHRRGDRDVQPDESNGERARLDAERRVPRARPLAGKVRFALAGRPGGTDRTRGPRASWPTRR